MIALYISALKPQRSLRNEYMSLLAHEAERPVQRQTWGDWSMTFDATVARRATLPAVEQASGRGYGKLRVDRIAVPFVTDAHWVLLSN